MKLWQEAGLPAGVINLVQGAKETGIALADAKGLDGVLFTGSANTASYPSPSVRRSTGQNVGARDGRQHTLLVITDQFGDADATVYTIIQSAFISAGQRCTCARRLYVPVGEKGRSTAR